MARVYVLGGRTFAPTEQMSSKQDGWLVGQVSDMGLFDLLKDRANRSEEDIGRDLLVAALRTGRFHGIIAGGVLEEGKAKWTVKDAEAVAEFLGDLTAPDDKAQLMTLFGEVLQRFFLGAASLMPTATSSKPTSAGSETSETHSAKHAEPSMTKQAAAVGPNAPDSLPMATATA